MNPLGALLAQAPEVEALRRRYHPEENMLNGRTLKFKVEDVLEKLKENREKHLADYAVAKAGYRAKTIELAIALGKAAKKSSVDERVSHLRGGALEITQLPQVVPHVDDYDEAIAMLEMTCQTEIELEQSAFNQYMLDNWSWKKGFANTSAMYAK